MISLIIAALDEVPSLLVKGQEMLPPLVADNLPAFVGTLVVMAFYFMFLAQPKSAPPRFPILAPLLQGKFELNKTGPCGLIKKGYEELGEVFRLKLLHKNVTMMIGPEAQGKFFLATDDVLSQREVYGFTVPVFGKGIVYDAPQKMMTQQLRFVSKGLTGVNMAAHCGKIIEETQAFFDTWGDEGEVNLMTALSELTILTASRCLLGNEIRENVHKEFADYYQQLSDGMSHLSFFMPHAPTKAHRERDAARKKIVEIFSKVIEERRRTNAQGNTDFLQVMIDARYKDGSIVTTEEIIGLLLAGLFAGQHTSNITGTWLGLLINSRKEELVPRLLEEQERVLAETDGEVTLEALNKMELLHSCMKETLRMYPPLIMLMRQAKQDIPYKDFVIPKGDIVAACPPVANRLSEVYTNPDMFDPDRFMAPREEDKAQKFSFISFGGGRHGCLGEKFGFLQTKTIWSELVRNFEFEPLHKSFPLPDYSAIVVGPRVEECMVRFKRKVPRATK